MEEGLLSYLQAMVLMGRSLSSTVAGTVNIVATIRRTWGGC